MKEFEVKTSNFKDNFYLPAYNPKISCTFAFYKKQYYVHNIPFNIGTGSKH